MGRITGAILRGILVLALVFAPGLIVPDLSISGWQIALIIGSFCGILTAVEYLCDSAVFIDFRDAPPFNRIRFIVLFLLICTTSVVMSPTSTGSLLGDLLFSIGLLVSDASQMNYLPLKLVADPLTQYLSADDALRIQASVGLAFVGSLIAMFLYFCWSVITKWPPKDKHGFNFWANMPTFEPTAKGDVVWRMQKEGWINISIGIVFPFLAPLFFQQVVAILGHGGEVSVHTAIWLISFWAFLPVNFVMQGMAMLHVANLIKAARLHYAAENSTKPFMQLEF